ncbi:MAG: ArsR/SmtB family transcription factor [Halodesulfurarchaeum sp.]
MSRIQDLLSSQQPESHDQSVNPRIIDIADENAGDVFQALSSDTARQLFLLFRDELRPPPDLAEELDTSIQNIHYHLKKLVEADLVEPVDTWYSEKGVEMKVYAPTDNPLIISSADDDQRSALRRALSRLLGVAVLGGASAGVQWWVTKQLGDGLKGNRELPTEGARHQWNWYHRGCCFPWWTTCARPSE